MIQDEEQQTKTGHSEWAIYTRKQLYWKWAGQQKL